MPRVLVLLDGEATDGAIRRALSGWEIHRASSIRGARRVMSGQAFDLVVVECSPHVSIARIERLALAQEVPLVVVASSGGDNLVAECLEAGAADFVALPVSDRELRARAEKRALGSGRPSGSFGGLTIEPASYTVVVDGRAVDLTEMEYDLLTFLVSSRGRAFSKQQLLRAVWGSSSEWQSDATVTEHVHRLRKKIERDPSNPEYIVTVRGVGYRFQTPPETLAS